jgi:hypothetical protein
LATATELPVSTQKRENDRLIGQRLRAEAREGDWIAFVGLSRPSIDYYLSDGRPGRPDSLLRRLHFPASTGANPAAVYPTPAESIRVWEAEAYALREGFEGGAGREDRAFYYVGPILPQSSRQPTAADLPYPGNILAYILNGLRPCEPIVRLRGDRVGADWILFRVVRGSLIPLDQLEPVEAAR